MTDTFDAVLAELQQPETLRLHMGEMTPYEVMIAQAAVRFAHSRLAAAHAAEDSEIREILYGTLDRDRDNITTRNLVVVAVNALQRERERAEAAERDARGLRAILYEAVGDDAKDWESGDGWPMGRFLVPALAGDYATAASEFAAYNAERAAIATTEQARGAGA